MNLRDFVREAMPHMRVIVAAGITVRLLVLGAAVLAATGRVWEGAVSVLLAVVVAAAAAVYVADRMPD